ncbi:hypothetical protein FFI97_025205 [Variovorax sp. KBS0712]|nr:hypothetical protein FFI97_025205 [Variovorax sp. KBS0712]
MVPQLPAHARTVVAKQQLWHELDMLCRLGVGLAPIAPEVCGALRTLVGADAAALFWMDEQGLPAGFFHEDSPASTQNLFLNEFERLFVGARETNVFALARPDGPRVGRLLTPDASYFRSNSYNLLVRASGHHHVLDMRVEVLGRTRAVVSLFRAPGARGFDADNAAVLERTTAHLARAFARAPTPPWNDSIDSLVGHVLLDAADRRPVLVDVPARLLLQTANLRGVGLKGGSDAPLPSDIASHLGLRSDLTDQPIRIPVPHGVLVVKAHLMHPPTGTAGSSAQLLLTLQLQRMRQIDVVRRIRELPLSPLQREIAALAGLGHARADCTALTGVGQAALKKHLRVILDVAGATDWDSLARALRA